MGLIRGLIAFVDALDGDRTAAGPAPAAAAPAPVGPPPPLGPVVEALAARVAALESSLEGVRGYAKQEADRAVRSSESAGRAVRRLRDELQGGDPELDADQDVRGDDAPGGRIERMPPVHGGVDVGPPAAPSDHDVRASIQRSLILERRNRA